MQLRTLLVWLIKKEQQKWEEEQITAWPNPKYKGKERALYIFKSNCYLFQLLKSKTYSSVLSNTLKKKTLFFWLPTTVFSIFFIHYMLCKRALETRNVSYQTINKICDTQLPKISRQGTVYQTTWIKTR